MYGHGIHYIFEGERLGVLRKFFSFQLVFPPPPLTICSTVESLPKPFTPLAVSPYSLYHDSLSISRGQGCLSSSIYVFFLMQCALNVYTMWAFFQVNIFRPLKSSQVLVHIHGLPDVRPLSETRCVLFELLMTCFPSSCAVVWLCTCVPKELWKKLRPLLFWLNTNNTLLCVLLVLGYTLALTATHPSVIFLSPFMLILLSFTFVSVSAKK